MSPFPLALGPDTAILSRKKRRHLLKNQKFLAAATKFPAAAVQTHTAAGGFHMAWERTHHPNHTEIRHIFWWANVELEIQWKMGEWVAKDMTGKWGK